MSPFLGLCYSVLGALRMAWFHCVTVRVIFYVNSITLLTCPHGSPDTARFSLLSKFILASLHSSTHWCPCEAVLTIRKDQSIQAQSLSTGYDCTALKHFIGSNYTGQ